MIEVHTSSSKMETRFMGLGNLIESNNVQEVLEQSGLNWTVSKRPIVTTSSIPSYKKIGNPNLLNPNGTETIDNLRYHVSRLLKDPSDENILNEVKDLLDETENSYIPHINEFSIVRDDTNYPFGVLGRIYECLSNAECIAILEPLLEEDKVVIERAGSFNGGANCWIIARFPEVISIAGECIDQYMKLSWSHDGTEKLSATFIAYIRNTNTQISPSIPGARESIEIRHTTNAKKRMEIAKQLLQKGASYFNALEDKLIELIHTPWLEKDMRQYLEVLIPDSEKAKETGEKTRSSQRRNEILNIFKESGDKINESKYAGFTSIAQWCDHSKQIRVTSKNKADGDIEQMRKESKLQGLWMKSGAARKMKSEAFKLIIQ